MKKLIVVFVAFILSISAEVLVEGQVFRDITYMGEHYPEISVYKVTPAYMSVRHKAGGKDFMFHELDENFRKSIFPDYDFKKAQAFLLREEVERKAAIKAIQRLKFKEMQEKKAATIGKELSIYLYKKRVVFKAPVMAQNKLYYTKVQKTSISWAHPKLSIHNGELWSSYNFSVTISSKDGSHGFSYNSRSGLPRVKNLLRVNQRINEPVWGVVPFKKIADIKDSHRVNNFDKVMNDPNAKISVTGTIHFLNGTSKTINSKNTLVFLDAVR